MTHEKLWDATWNATWTELCEKHQGIFTKCYLRNKSGTLNRKQVIRADIIT